MTSEQSAPSRHTRPRWLRMLRGCLLTLVCLAILSAITLGGGYWYFSRNLPPIDNLGAHRPFETTKIYARDGTTLLYELYDPNAGQRTVVAFSAFPEHLKQATIAIEDANFYSNPGVNVASIIRAAWANATNQDEGQGGASTITQQLVRNVLLPPEERTEQSLRRKIREAILAYRISKHYSKDQILALYLNEIPYGNNAYGAEAAAQAYFGVSVGELSLAQAALLAGLPQAPSQLDPLVNPVGAKERQRLVLNAMARNGFISSQEALSAYQEDLYIYPARVNLRAPHFVFYVRDQLEQRYGYDLLSRGGLRVITTLDPAWQDTAQQLVRERVAEIQDQNASNGAVVMLDRETNQILALVGSADYNNEAIDGQVNIALAERQPGSTLKPFVYAAAMMKGWTAATVLWDVPTQYGLSGGEVYAPQNYDRSFHGPVSIRAALANSFNVPAVKALEFVGIDAFLHQLHAMGVSTLNDRPRYGLSLALGGGEVKLLDLTSAYSVLANGGAYRPPVSILRVENTRGEVLETWHAPDPQQVMGPNGAQIAYIITHILSDNAARQWMFGPGNAMELADARPAAVKTGTTDDDRDSWTVGYTPEIVVGAWVGNSDNSPMTAVPGSFGAAVIWQRLMNAYHADKPIEQFERPEGIEEHMVCSTTGKLPSPACPASHTELFVAGTAPTEQDTMYRLVRVGPGGDCVALPGQPGEDRIFALYPPEAAGWMGAIPSPPTTPCATNGTTNESVAITSPTDGSTVGTTVRIRGSAQGPFALSWGAGATPTAWQEIVAGPGGIRDGLLGVWTAPRQAGTYTLRLTVSTPVGPLEQRIRVNVDLTPPTLSLVAPAGGAVDEALRLSVTTNDSSGIVRVEWDVNGQIIDRTSPPWEIDWIPKIPGMYRIRATAVDAAGNRTSSQEVIVDITR